jgi:oxygen-dependent protoporphyrinogen oxidase
MHDVIVIGGGIAGLTAAYKLQQAGWSTLVLERQPQAGGNVRTIEERGFRLEVGPSSFMGSSEYLWRLIGELGLDEAVEPAQAVSKNRYIYRDGGLHPLPMSAGSFLRTPLLSLRAKLRLALEPFIPGNAGLHDTAWEFFVRRFGEEAATYIMSPFISGIYAGDVRQLGARAAFKKFWDFENDSGSMILGAWRYMRAKRRRLAAEGLVTRKGLFSFLGGLGRVTGALAGELTVRTGVEVTGLRREAAGHEVVASGETYRSRAVVLAVPPPRAARLLAAEAPEAVAPLDAVPMAPVALIHWALPRDAGPLPRGFGFLMPRLYDLRVLGTIFASQLFTGRAPADRELLSSFYGGMLDPEAVGLSDEELGALVHREHERIFGVRLSRPEVLAVLRYDSAIPQLLPDHPERIETVRRAVAALGGLFLAGNYLTGVGIEHAVHSGYDAAAACDAHLRAAGPAAAERSALSAPRGGERG